MDLSVIIVSWNTRKLLENCLKSIYEKTRQFEFEIIVVDNASQDGSAEMIRTKFPECKLVESKNNLGFSKANNLGIGQADGKYLLFLNPDTQLKTSALDGMINFLERSPEYGAVGCKLLNSDASIQFTCAREFPTPFREFCFLAMLDRFFPGSKVFSTTEMRYWNHQHSRDIDCLSGACIMTRKKIADQLGGLSEKYFMYAEDVELCYRIRKAGWLIYYLGSEEIYHFSGSSSSQRKERSFSAVMQREANYRFMIENYGKRVAMSMRAFVFVGAGIRLIVMLMLIPMSVVFNDSYAKISKGSFRKYLDIFVWSVKGRSLLRK
jgi:GT2 family glycosyltransferase